MIIDTKDRQFRLIGFATGSYTNKCIICEDFFMGDKRAVHCLPCAVDIANGDLEKAKIIKKSQENVTDFAKAIHEDLDALYDCLNLDTYKEKRFKFLSNIREKVDKIIEC